MICTKKSFILTILPYQTDQFQKNLGASFVQTNIFTRVMIFSTEKSTTDTSKGPKR